MESQGYLREAGCANASVVTCGIFLVNGSPNSGQPPPIPLAPIFHGFPRRRINCHSYISIPTCLQFHGMGSVFPPKALLAPQLISRKTHQNEAPKNRSLTTPNPSRKKEFHGRNQKLSNWTMPKGCGAIEACSPLEGPLGHSTHFASGGDAKHIQRTAKARCAS